MIFLLVSASLFMLGTSVGFFFGATMRGQSRNRLLSLMENGQIGYAVLLGGTKSK